MKLIATQPIRLRADLTLAPGDEFEPDEHALSKRDVAELLAIGAAELLAIVAAELLACAAAAVLPDDLTLPLIGLADLPAELPEPAEPAKPAKAAAASKAAK